MDLHAAGVLSEAVWSGLREAAALGDSPSSSLEDENTSYQTVI